MLRIGKFKKEIPAGKSKTAVSLTLIKAILIEIKSLPQSKISHEDAVPMKDDEMVLGLQREAVYFNRFDAVCLRL